VQRSIVRGLSKDYKGIRDLGTKEALFVVLLGARMPSILVETSFLSNPEDEQRLSSEAYQEALADQIAEAVDGFLDERNKIAQVD
jgi:N-acetylmuramoyl-L-alanine amidase